MDGAKVTRVLVPDWRSEMTTHYAELRALTDRLALFLKKHQEYFFMSNDPALAGRWRRVTLVGTDGHMVSGWVPADVADSVNVTITISGVTYTVSDPFYPSVETIPPHDRLPHWPDAVKGTE
jgi:hypothetical protein